MLMNSKGFTFTEALVALNIVLVIVFTVAPIIYTIHFERQILYDRRTISSKLHDDIQAYVYGDVQLPDDYVKTINDIPVQVKIKTNNNYIKGCADWKNIKQREEEICLYGLPINK